jgi:hypothetical protein
MKRRDKAIAGASIAGLITLAIAVAVLPVPDAGTIAFVIAIIACMVSIGFLSKAEATPDT